MTGAAATKYSDDQVRAIASAVVLELMLKMGIDATDPKALTELQQDFAHVRAWRRSTQLVMSKGLGAAVYFIVTAGLGYAAYLITGKYLH